MRDFRHPMLWLLIGWFGIALLVVLSLVNLSLHSTLEHGDKLFHLLVYLLLMGWFVQLYRRAALILLHAVLLVMLGVAMEFLQVHTGRYFELADMLANTLGVILGAATALTPLRDRLQQLEQWVFV